MSRPGQGRPDERAQPKSRRGTVSYFVATAAVAAVALLVVAWAVPSNQTVAATLAYLVAIVAVLAISATFQRVNRHSLDPRPQTWLDHSLIFIFIAASYTPFAWLALPHPTEHLVVAIGWGAALSGIALTLLFPTAPRWMGAPLCLMVGSASICFTGTVLQYSGTILQSAGAVAVVMLLVGGAFYSIGGVLYALLWLDPGPRAFLNQKICHAFIALAAMCHYVAMCLAVF
ncbi:hemolysin III family protein [Mycobacterium sp. 050128]|uniref:PAQR family membrane homeostasis protein TrhA n=1 Tax=Mycobacterium sp. 050128 TaxID=3096112 RepID=UPI002ED9EA06